MDLFTHTWAALRAAVADLPGQAFTRPSGCAGWLVRDLVCHLIIDAQDVLITLATPSAEPPTRDALTYWEVLDAPPAGDDALDALIVRLAAAYREPSLLTFHLDDLGAAAGRAAVLAPRDQCIATKGQVLTVGDYLDAYVLEWTLHHLDLVAYLPDAAAPPAAGLSRARQMVEQIAGYKIPAALSDTDALLIGTGRRSPTAAQAAALGTDGNRIPVFLR
ncbi:Mycothiol maleylpyruvate isomerase N-terminal domain protein [Mycolicibacterium phlei]|uniref:maleylpyruvate isomerase N-terminal domain-containing protein n=1 Tax=Mycobacteroides chelonae TaxID=1774 RepID=UPI0007B42496|nr:maleylpyruvate isomerase N-terminal domain-containing protein [Mycobacteroides chelonae]ANA98479.1 maleylpyruvate isomerase [Mycobacteroides chelonae CCUG 47445]OLT72265.1 maleylpyruvate isomerase [Mycobacteroides chelonae]ORV11585.1 maleylpyruvate isomerase [Mycobacteroides chelonae]VEG16832.1 Mycothiol maleylpyruvate isomerase N-terminal domain protein [Mycolicibacterium phlei]